MYYGKKNDTHTEKFCPGGDFTHHVRISLSYYIHPAPSYPNIFDILRVWIAIRV